MVFGNCFRNKDYGWIITPLLMTVALVAPTPSEAQPFTLVCMPDPQYYSNTTNATKYNIYNRQTTWIRDNKTLRNIQHVIWLGDLTNDNTLAQWNVANAAYRILDLANIPYAVVPGNHDYKTPTGWAGANLRNLNYYNGYVGPQRFTGKTWYGGNMGETTNHNENNYTYFSGGGMDFLVIGLEYAPRKEVLTWANNLISQHPNHRVILFTHSYLTGGGKYGGYGSATGTVGASGSEIFEECAKRHSNVFMVVCGHVTESHVNTKLGVAGNRIFEMLVDYQSEKALNAGGSLGNGWLRTLQFDPANNRINANTISAASGDNKVFIDGLDWFYVDEDTYQSNPQSLDHQFSLLYDMGPPQEPYSYLNSSVGFHAMSVGADLQSDQPDPDIAQADNGNWVSVWEDDPDENGIYQVMVRGFDPDGNERFARQVVNPTGVNVVNATNPSVAMAADGRFVVVWQSGTTELRMRLYNADGQPVQASDRSVTLVPSTGSVNNPDVAMDNSGNFVVTWADDNDGNNTFQILARGFNSLYQDRFTTKTVNGNSGGQQVNPVIAMAGNGDYVVAWDDDRSGTWDIGLRGYRANELDMFTETLANTTTAGEQISPDIAMDDSSRFVVIWEDDADLNQAFQIKARGFQPNGSQLFAEKTVNVDSSGNQINPAVAMDNFGNWYPVWEDNGQGGEGYQIMWNTFSPTGSRLNTADGRVNPVTSVSNKFGSVVRKGPSVIAHDSGRFLVSWADDMDGDTYFQPLVRGMGGLAKSLVIKAFNGTVSKSDDQPFYATNSTVTLTATPDSGRSFVRWSGDVPGGSSGQNPLTITMNASKKITAEFSAASSVTEWSLY